MNLKELSESVAGSMKEDKKTAKKAVETVFKAIQDELAKGGEVKIPGFGCFSTSKRPARMGINPQDGKEIKIEARTVAKFKPFTQLKEAVIKAK